MVKIRNVRVYSAGEQGKEIAGFWQHGDVSVTLFREWIDSFCIFMIGRKNFQDWGFFQINSDGPYAEKRLLNQMEIHEGTMPEGNSVILNRSNLQPVRCILDELEALPRTASINTSAESGSAPNFTDRIRARDGGCCMSRATPESEGGSYAIFKTTHIVLHGQYDIWANRGFADLITDTYESIGPGKIDSIQNGILLRTDFHEAFDAFLFAVNPDENYTIIDFTKGGCYRKCLNMKINGEVGERPLDQLLRFHFFQAILTNIKGAADKEEK